MKKIICILLVFSLMAPLFAQTIAYADNYDVCAVYGNSHDFFHSYTLNVKHPHEGFFECECGQRLEADAIIESDCEICRDILCDAGLHYYIDSISFTNQAYGKCYCGEEMIINCTKSQYDKHVYYTSQGYVVEGCPVCEVGNEYYNNYEQFVLLYAFNYVPSEQEHFNEETKITHTGDSHDEYPSTSCYVEHPHEGWLECSCGKFSYFDSHLVFDCLECHKVLCSNNIHYYDHDVSYLNKEASVSCRYCDSTTYVSCSYTEVVEHANHLGSYSNCPFCQLIIDFWINCDDINELYFNNHIWEDERTYYEEEIEIPESPIPEVPSYDIQYFSSYTCSLTGKNHDFSLMLTCAAEHPHKGYFECECGEKLHFEQKIEDSCNECITELCKTGIHNYSYSIYSNYGKCSCGATQNFSVATNLYKALGIDSSSENYSVPCPECTFKTIHSNKVLEWELNNLLSMSSIIYSNNDISYANSHYIDALSYTSIYGCSHSSNYLEDAKSATVPTFKPTPETTTPSTPSKPQTNNTTSNTTTTNKKQESVTPILPYYEYDLPDFYNMQSVQLPSRDYTDAINDVASQLFLGNYAERVTTGGTIAEVIFSLTGLDIYKDFTDLLYNFTHWEFTWSHVGNTLLNAVALLPIVGAVKNADEIAVLRKLAKLDPDTVKNLDKIGGINSSLLLKLKKLNQSEVLGLMKKLDGHALTKHVGNTSEAALKAIRKGTNAISSFYTQDDAVKAVTSALKDPDVTAKIAYKMSLQDTSKFAVEFDVGKTIGVKIPKDSDKIVKCSKVRVIIQQTSDTDFYVKTAFPI